MADFATMSSEDREDLKKKIGQVCRDSGIDGIKIKMSRETVCPLAAKAVEDTISLTIEKTCAPDKKDLVDKFKTDVAAVIGTTKNVK